MSETSKTADTNRSVLPRCERYRQAAALLRQWQAERGAYDERTWPALEKELKNSALGCSEKDESGS